MSLMSCAHCGREIVPGIPCHCFGPRPVCDHVWRANGDYEYCTRCSINRRKEPVVSFQHIFSGDRVQAALDRIERQQASLMLYFISGEKRIMATLKDLTDALKDLGTTIPDYIAKRDAIDADLNKKISDLQAEGTMSTQAIDEAFAAAVADKALLTPPAVEVPVVDGGTVTEAPAA